MKEQAKKIPRKKSDDFGILQEMVEKILDEKIRRLAEVGMSRAALGVSEKEYRKVMSPAVARGSLGLKDLYDIVSLLDPTSLTSYPGAIEAIKDFYDKPSYYNGFVLTLALLELVPVAGKVAKIGGKALELQSKTLKASAKMKKVIEKVPEAAGDAGTLELMYSKQKEFAQRARRGEFSEANLSQHALNIIKEEIEKFSNN
jgi:hypothetical protein